MRTSIFVRALASRRSCNQPENVSLCLIVGILLLLFIRDSAPFDNQFQPGPLPILAGQDGRPPPGSRGHSHLWQQKLCCFSNLQDVVTLPARPKFEAFQSGRDIEADLALHAQRLQRDRIAGAADQ